MRVQGEFIFKSYDEAYNYMLDKLTNYERLNGIVTTYIELAIDEPDFKAVKYFKSDNSITLIVFFKNSVLFDVWKVWTPSREQFLLLPLLVELYNSVNKHNNNLSY